VPASSLRYYEKLGLITSERETSGSSAATAKRLLQDHLDHARAERGFNLDEIASN